MMRNFLVQVDAGRTRTGALRANIKTRQFKTSPAGVQCFTGSLIIFHSSLECNLLEARCIRYFGLTLWGPILSHVN